MKFPFLHFSSPRRALPVVTLWLLAACNSGGTSAQATQTGNTPSSPKRSHSLAIIAYNYTDRYMDSFEVNGQGGGNVRISNEGAGGGSQVCCVRWTDGSVLPKKITVKWVANYCMQSLTNGDGETKAWRQSLWKIADLQFKGPVPANPRNFEVHFYRDGHIELAMSEDYSLPRLKLPSPPNGYVRPGVVVNDPPCPEDYDSVAAYDHPERVDAIAKGQP